MSKILIPPIKCQGIKTKIVPLLLENITDLKSGLWIEPFMGSGVVGLNVRPSKALFADLNPHIIAFYDAIKTKIVTPESSLAFLEHEGRLLREKGESHYYTVRERFNKEGSPLDFLFLSRSCFNGMIRFNKNGGFNVPFCRKPNRFAGAYITKIVNQLTRFSESIHSHSWAFINQDFEKTISSASEIDFIYCDPPYIGRHVDYFNSWNASDEERLLRCLSESKARFILSTWHSNKYRKNEFLDSFWSRFHVITKEHFYHVGAREENRNSMLEALVMNFVPKSGITRKSANIQRSLFDRLPVADPPGYLPRAAQTE
ncbi:MAG: Dam family site-specific DNA-(adenine-N6)-methyltransferase [Deltaproteobacteria bacterium]|nr:Dam family site-specific DNA-(adenine-N6)-methyltransferase [Deltaproteobacteria bacterium]